MRAMTLVRTMLLVLIAMPLSASTPDPRITADGVCLTNLIDHYRKDLTPGERYLLFDDIWAGSDHADTFMYSRTDIFSVIAVESSFNPRAVSQAGATGLMQLMPVAVLEAVRQCQITPPTQEQLFHVRKNVKLGSCFFRYLVDLYKGDRILALAHYNGGGRQAEKIRSGEVPVAETANYIVKVLYVRATCLDKSELERLGQEVLTWPELKEEESTHE